MPRIVITEFMDAAAVEGLAADYDVLFDPTLCERPDEIIEAARHACALIVRNRTQVRGELLVAAAHLKAVGRLGVGLDNIDMEACKVRGIAVLPAVGANAATVAEYVMAGILMLLRGVYFANPAMIAGAWPRTDLIGREAGGRRLGLVGFGSIARATAAKGQALGMAVSAFDPFVPEDDPAWREMNVTSCALPELLGSCDAISLHVPLTDGTRHLIDAAALARMDPGAVLINAARGGVVDEAALIDALRAGKLGGAMLDVFEDEPLTDGAKFAGVPNLILTPHIAGLTIEAHTRVSQVTADNVRRVLEGFAP